MSTKKSTVKSRPLSIHKAAACVTTLEAQIAAGMSCAEVQNAPAAKAALDDLAASVVVLKGTMSDAANLIIELRAARKANAGAFSTTAGKNRNYESSVEVVAGGNAAIITAAGALARDAKTPGAALEVVKDVKSKPGKAAREAIVTWPRVPGATSYAIQVNANLEAPTGPYAALPSGTSRRRVILAPAPGVQILVQIAAVAGDGSQSAWCDAILATAR